MQDGSGFVYSERITLRNAWHMMRIPTNLLAILQASAVVGWVVPAWMRPGCFPLVGVQFDVGW